MTIDPDLKPTKTDEYTVGVTRELAQNLSIAATYRHRKDSDLTWLINPGVTADDYTIVTGRDPGPDGVLNNADDGGPIDFYNISAAKRVLSPNLITTFPGFSQEYDGVELTLYRRFANRWQFVGSYTAGRQKENYNGPLNQLGAPPAGLPTPQDVDKKDGTPIGESKPAIVKFLGSYLMPWNITVSGNYAFVSGDRFTRTVNSANAGVTLNQGNIAVLAGERNVEHYDGYGLLDWRIAYDLTFGGQRKLQFAFDMFNTMNTNVVTQQNLVSGSAYSRVINFIPPRIVRFGVKATF